VVYAHVKAASKTYRDLPRAQCPLLSDDSSLATCRMLAAYNSGESLHWRSIGYKTSQTGDRLGDVSGCAAKLCLYTLSRHFHAFTKLPKVSEY